jgi:hypothetical protein
MIIMEVYKFINLDNDDILLEKTIIDNTNYIIIKQEDGNILLKKNNFVDITDIKDIKNYDFKKSSILECSINNEEFNKLKYKSILEEIYKIINDGVIIIKHTKLNIKTIKKENEGYYYLDDIGISVQGVDSNKCLLEIINQCIENEIELKIKIKLINNIIIYLTH